MHHGMPLSGSTHVWPELPRSSAGLDSHKLQWSCQQTQEVSFSDEDLDPLVSLHRIQELSSMEV